MDFPSAHTLLHEQAIYQHDAEQYQVEKLDLPNKKAFVRKIGSDYFTTAMTRVRVSVIEDAQVAELGSGATASAGEVSVVEKVVGFKKIKFHTHENVGYGEVALPELQMHTTSLWLTLPERLVSSLNAPRAAVIDALRGLCHALHTVACVGLMGGSPRPAHRDGQRRRRRRGASERSGCPLQPDAVSVRLGCRRSGVGRAAV
jgi:DEAD/DEAH box helicase domain-containing protein